MFFWMDPLTMQARFHSQSLLIEMTLECGHPSICVMEGGEAFYIDLSVAHVGPAGFYFQQTSTATGSVCALNYTPSPARPPRLHPLDVYHRILGLF